MQSFDAKGFLNNLADQADRNLNITDKDYKDENGLWICGVCGKPKQIRLEAINRIVTCACDCDFEEQRRFQERMKRNEALEIVKRIWEISPMDKKLRKACFDTYQVNKHNEKILKSCKRYVEEFDQNVEDNKGLLFYGDVGTGKTWSAACIANALMAKGEPVVMTSFIKLIGQIQMGVESEAEILRRLNWAKLVIFDDLGAERSTDYAVERVYNIVDSRNRADLPIIVTTNLTLNEMKAETDMRFKRIYDRLFEVCIPVKFTGNSWRRKEAGLRFAAMENDLNDMED